MELKDLFKRNNKEIVAIIAFEKDAYEASFLVQNICNLHKNLI